VRVLHVHITQKSEICTSQIMKFKCQFFQPNDNFVRNSFLRVDSLESQLYIHTFYLVECWFLEPAEIFLAETPFFLEMSNILINQVPINLIFMRV